LKPKHQNILHCIASLKGGGAEKQLCLLSSALISKGYDVHVIILSKGVNYQRLKNSGAKIYEINARSNYDFKILFKIVKYIKINNINIVQCWQRPMDFFGSLSAIIAHVNYITTERTCPDRYSNSLKGLIKYMVAQFAAANISNSELGMKYWDKYLWRNIPNVFIPNIVPFDELKSIQIESNKVKSDTIIVIGRLSPEKNHILIVKALSKFLKDNSNFVMCFVGEGLEYGNLVREIKTLGLQSKIKLIGFTSDVLNLINNSKIFISMSLFEGMPNSVFEAAALKIPMVLSDIPSHSNYFNTESAFLVNPNSELELYNCVSDLWCNYDVALLKTQIAFNLIKKFDADYVADEHIKLYKNILGNG
jgi:glycosyltransferase involved in cell wall biosynthesis